jgi:hypothetical protein
MKSILNALDKFFGVFLHPQTYLNGLYLLLSFPLGLFYFIFLVVGLSAGIPLVIVWVGLLVLAGVFAAWWGFIVFERQLAIWLLREDIPLTVRQNQTGKSLWQKVTAELRNPVTWKGLLYLLLKFPLGTFSFVVWVSLISLSGALLLAPFYYWVFPISINLSVRSGVWIISTLPQALLLCVAGFLILIISMHILNGLAWVSGRFARVMLGDFSKPVSLPAAAPAEVPAAEPQTPPAAEETSLPPEGTPPGE